MVTLPILLDPYSRVQLTCDTPHSVTDGMRRYPIVAGIPYLRTNREELRAAALALLDSEDETAALVLLLQDQDDWARVARPSEAAIQNLLACPGSLRDAMRALNFGPVSDYFAYRWSDPTFLSGLALLHAHLPRGSRVLEIGCGIGHFLREFELRDIPAVGADVVFAKLWLAKQYVAPSTPLVCMDASAPFVFNDAAMEAVFCHDAFYFLPNKQQIADEMSRIVGPQGTILIGHTHNSVVNNFSAGESLTQAEYCTFFPRAIVYDDAELTRSFIEGRAPYMGAGDNAEAFAFVTGEADDTCGFVSDVAGQSWRTNPLYQRGSSKPDWPSDLYKQEYASLSDYLTLREPPASPTPELIRRRVFLSLPERW